MLLQKQISSSYEQGIWDTSCMCTDEMPQYNRIYRYGYNAKMYIFAFTLQSRCPKDTYITFPIDLPLTLIHISCIICTYTVLILNFNEHKNMRARKYFN